jgi:glucose/mannose-6-phosphate isomerase
MQNLDDLERFQALDPQNMLAEIDGLPDQLERAWSLGHEQPLPLWRGIERVLIAGMGGSAIGGDLLEVYAAPHCPVPVVVHRDYDLPAWASSPQTLVIAASHSGNTEETLSAFALARERGCRLLAISTGGQLKAAAEDAGVPAWLFDHAGQPRAAIGFSFGLLLAAFTRLALVPDPTMDIQAALRALRQQQQTISADVPVVRNSAKRMAGQLIGRWVSVFGAGVLAPVARRWKGQLSEVGKAWAQFEFLPEADHNTLAGVVNPEELFPRTMMIFLTGAALHPRNRLRLELTRKIFMLEGLNTDFVEAQGESRLENLWTALHYGDYTAYYLAMAYGVDPTPVAAIEDLKAELKAAG